MKSVGSAVAKRIVGNFEVDSVAVTEQIILTASEDLVTTIGYPLTSILAGIAVSPVV